MGNTQKSDTASEGKDDSRNEGMLYPYLHNGFSRGVFIVLIPAILSCVILRAPQYRLSEILGTKLPISFDAISLSLLSPWYFIVCTWLLLGSAERSKTHRQHWGKREVTFFGGVVALLGLTVLFMLAQFFLELAPEGTCDQRPHWELLWSLQPAAWPVNHCMSTAAEINKTPWHYAQPVFLQAWVHIVFTALSLYFLWMAWRAWKRKLPQLSNTRKAERGSGNAE